MHDCSDELVKLTDRVFSSHSELKDHRRDHPWLLGRLGDIHTSVWFVAENPGWGPSRYCEITKRSRIRFVEGEPGRHTWARRRMSTAGG